MNFVHIGWRKDEKANSDKVWGVICLKEQEYSHQAMRWIAAGKFVTFWGRRGAKLQTKLWEGTDWDATEMFLKKQNKGYQSIEVEELDRVYPEFREDLGKITMIAILKA